MILIKTLTVKNFMSVGNQTQAIDFQQKLLTLVLGENLDMGGDDAGSRNGTGKTTIVNALSYALYGEALTKIRRDNLVNKTNGKGMLVTITFEKEGKKYKVERGRKPNVMKYFISMKQDLRTRQKVLGEAFQSCFQFVEISIPLVQYLEMVICNYHNMVSLGICNGNTPSMKMKNFYVYC